MCIYFLVFPKRKEDLMEFLGTLCLVLISTALAGSLSRKAGMPAVIGQLDRKSVV